MRQVLRQLFSEQDHNAERALCPEEMDIIHEGIKKIEIEKPTKKDKEENKQWMQLIHAIVIDRRTAWPSTMSVFLERNAEYRDYVFRPDVNDERNPLLALERIVKDLIRSFDKFDPEKKSLKESLLDILIEIHISAERDEPDIKRIDALLTDAFPLLITDFFERDYEKTLNKKVLLGKETSGIPGRVMSEELHKTYDPLLIQAREQFQEIKALPESEWKSKRLISLDFNSFNELMNESWGDQREAVFRFPARQESSS